MMASVFVPTMDDPCSTLLSVDSPAPLFPTPTNYETPTAADDGDGVPSLGELDPRLLALLTMVPPKASCR